MKCISLSKSKQISSWQSFNQ